MHSNFIHPYFLTSQGSQGPPGPRGEPGPQGVPGVGQGGGVMSYTNLTDYNRSKTKEEVFGPLATIMSGQALPKGAPVILSLDNGARVVSPDTSGELPLGLFGVTTTSSSLANEQVTVALAKSFTTINMSTILAETVTQLLDKDYSTTDPFTGSSYLFRDSGDITKDYSSEEGGSNGWCATFDAGTGHTWKIDFISDSENEATHFSFEHSNRSYLYDRLGLQHSANGVQFENASIPWMIPSQEPLPPWSSVPLQNSPGWILPEDVRTAVSKGFSGKTEHIPFRFIRFYFHSDGSITKPGWSISLTSTRFQAGKPELLAFGTPLYIDKQDPTKVSSTVNGAVVAHSVGSDTSNDKVYTQVVDSLLRPGDSSK